MDRLQLTIGHLLDSSVSENTWRTYESARINFLYYMYTFGLLEVRQSWSCQRFLPEAVTSIQWTAYHAHLYRATMLGTPLSSTPPMCGRG